MEQGSNLITPLAALEQWQEWLCYAELSYPEDCSFSHTFSELGTMNTIIIIIIYLLFNTYYIFIISITHYLSPWTLTFQPFLQVAVY